MRNLTIHSRSGRNLKLSQCIAPNLLLSEILYTINPNNDELYFLSETKLFVVPSDNQKDIVIRPVNTNVNSKIVGLEYSNITQQLYCAYKSGHVVAINVESEGELKCDTVAEINVDLECMRLSPDHGMLIFVTATGYVITMVSTFQIISEVKLHSSDFGEKQFITVGWGKKETQFHGSQGKAAAAAKPVQIERNTWDDDLPRISWHGDGSFFAVSFMHNETKARLFKVFNREGVLQYTGELVNGLEEPIAWKPSGYFVATAQRLVNKHVIALFERNGLKHREFTLPFEAEEIRVKDLFWSPDSDILAVWCEHLSNDTTMLQLWVENNYHWYLKQTMNFNKCNPLLYATWSATSRSGKKLIILTLNELIVCSFHWTVNNSKGKDVNDKAVVGVIDGRKALVTGFRIGIVPPPMAHQSLQVDAPINAIVFAPAKNSEECCINSNSFFCYSSDNKFTFFKHVPDASLLEYEQIGSYEVKWDISEPHYKNFLYNMHHFLWFKKDIILCSVFTEGYSFLCVLNVNEFDAEKEGCVIVQQMHMMDGLIEHIIDSPDPEVAYVVVDGTVFKYVESTGLDPTENSLQEFVYQVEAIKIDTTHVLVSLSHRNGLAMNRKVIGNNITSFYVHSEFLLLTTLQHTLICVELNKTGIERLINQDLTVRPWENGVTEKSLSGLTNLNLRRVERGSRIITAVSSDSKTILQMPRGNLECIQPRALSLHIVGMYLNNLDYLAAFDQMRKQHINLNLIYDHDPTLFRKNARKFLEDIKKPNWLSLFFSELQDEDVTETIYASSYLDRPPPPEGLIKTNKVERTCDLLRSIMENRPDVDNLIQPILISLVKNQDIDGLEAALKKLKHMRQLEETENRTLCISSENALTCLLSLVDVNLLFDTALGMYDFDMAIFVASKSQKDPKEYIPFLNNLRKLDQRMMEYSIDVHLKRYQSALRHIIKVPEKFKDALEFIQNHNLYTFGLRFFKPDSDQYKEIAKIFAKFLLNEKKYPEAALMFRKGGDFANALNVYKLAGNWQDAIAIALEMKTESTALNELYKELITRLKSNKKFQEAAHIYIYYLKNFEEGIICLLSGRNWKDAIRFAREADRSDLIDTRIKSAIYEHAECISNLMFKNREDFEKYKARLATVRQELTVKQIRLYDDLMCDNELTGSKGITDLLSDTNSSSGSVLSQKSRTSSGSGKSSRSTKNRKKQERKMLILKEGSAFEDLKLIRAMHDIIITTFKLKDEVSILVYMISFLGNDDYAQKLQYTMMRFLQFIEKSKPEIWDKSAPSSYSDLDFTDIVASSQSEELAVVQKLLKTHIMYPPEMSSAPWKLDMYSSV